MTSDTQRSELLPCPFCGSEAREDRTDRDDDCAAPRPHRVYRVECTSCDAFRESESADWFMSSFSPHPETPADLAAKADAIAAWNRRTPPKVGSEELDAAAKAVLESWDSRMHGEREEQREYENNKYWAPRASLVDSSAIAQLRAALASPVDHPEVVGEPVAWRRRLSDEPDGWFDITLTKEVADAWHAFRGTQTVEPLYAPAALQPSDSPALEAGAANLLTNCAQILDVVKGEWSKDGAWSEWDQSIRDGITAYLRATLSIPAKEDGKPDPNAGTVCEHGIRWPWACHDCDRIALQALEKKE